MRKATKLTALVIAAIILISVFPVVTAAGTVAYGAATVSASALNVRAGGDITAEKIGCLPNGTSVIVIDMGDGTWYHINYQGLEGYVHSSYLTDIVTEAAFSSSSTVTSSGSATVSASALNVRAGGDITAEKIGCLPHDAHVNVLDKGDGTWYRIKYQELEGFVHSAYLTDVSFSTVSTTVTGLSGVVTGEGVRVRSASSTSGSVLTSLSKGAEVTVLAIESGWYKIAVGGTTGYMRSDYISVTGSGYSSFSSDSSSASSPASSGSASSGSASSGSASSGSSSGSSSSGSSSSGSSSGSKTDYSAQENYEGPGMGGIPASYKNVVVAPGEYSEIGQKIANLAMKFNGSKYVYGAESPEDGFDCSGLVYYCYRYYGYNVERTASRQFKYNGTTVQKSDLKVGDLVFFSTNGTSVTHVGIYIGGNKFVHASNSTVGVIVSDLTTNYYTRYWFGAKRIA